MASASSYCFATIFRFTADVSMLASGSVVSPEIRLSDVNWKIELQKKTDETGIKNVLGVFLVSKFDKNTENFSIKAQAAFKLLRNDGQMEESIIKHLPKVRFSSIKQSHGFDDFVDWIDFLDRFVNENGAVFEIEITAEPLIQTFGLDIGYAKFRVVVNDVSELDSCYSSETVVRGIKWKLRIQRQDESLSAFLYGDTNDMDKHWSYRTECTLKLVSFHEDVRSIKYSFKHDFCMEMNALGYNKLLDWSDFVSAEKQYVRNDNACFIIEMKVDEPKPMWQIMDHKLSKANSLLECSICFECFATGKIFTIKCGHLFCKPCFRKFIVNQQVCPKCRTPTSADELHPIFFT